MSSQERIQRPAANPPEEIEELPAPLPGADLSATDELLDEIDEILESADQELVQNFIQVGGE